MQSDHRNIYFSITPTMKESLDAIKETHYEKLSQKAMIQDLIAKGLATVKDKNSTHKN